MENNDSPTAATKADQWTPNCKIIDFQLNEKSFIKRNNVVEHERAVALGDLLAMNRFRPVGDFSGPFKVKLGINDNKRLVFDILNEQDMALTDIILPLSPFRKIVKDYFHICESYYNAMQKLSPVQIETIDMARRGLHNEGAEILLEILNGKLLMDKATSRRLFTLICVLHI